MRVLYCEKTSDITHMLSSREAADLRRTLECSLVLEAESKGFTFHLIGSRSKDYMQVREPRGDYKHFWTAISDAAWNDLRRNHECGTRYGDSSKVKVCINEEL